MDVRVLGPLEVSREGRPVDLGTSKQRALFALLLLHRNEAVSVERLVDDLWDGKPPRTAAKIVQNYVSLLRRALAGRDGRADLHILTEDHAYVLRVPAGGLDADRFEALAARGREDLRAGRAEMASARLREALALWRGEPLADVRYERFAQAEIARLEERRLTVLEYRVEADLARGGHVDLVAELEALVRAHPVRERLRAQLMLALYRSGRQVEALEVYQQTRKTLVVEMGIEPGPALRELEQSILRQDRSLDLPWRLRPTSIARTRRGVLAVGAAVAAALTAVLLLSASNDPADVDAAVEPAIAVEPDSVVVIDPAKHVLTAAIRVGSEPGPIVFAAGSVWVANTADSTLSRIDPRTQRVVATIGLGIEPSGLAGGGRSVWVAGGRDGVLLRIDTRDNRIRGRARIREAIGPLPAGYERGPSAVAADQGALWLAHGEEVSRLDPVSLDVVETIRAGGSWSGAIVAGSGSVWVAENNSLKTRKPPRGFSTGITRIDPRSNRVVETVRAPGLRPPITGTALQPGALAIGEGSVWAAAGASDLLWRIDLRTGQVRTMPAGHEPSGVAVGAGSVWVENHGDQTVVRVDPFSNQPVETLLIGRPTRGIAVGAGAVWVSVV